TSPYWKPTTGELFKATVVRARAFKPQSITSRIATHTFFVDPAIRGMYSFPVISLATTASNFFDYNRGIYVPGVYFNPGNDRWTGNYFQRGDAWERPIHLEWFETNGAAAFSLDAGARINGALTRNIPAKCLRVFARDTYGTSWIKHPVFPGGGASAFKRLLLRTGGNEYAGSFLSDVIAEEAFNHTSIDFHRYRPAILFVNGEYWGIHNVCEYLNKHYLQTKYGFTDAQIEQFDIIEGVGAGYATSGNMAHYTAMLRCIETNILANNHALSPGTYAHVRTQMDVDNYIDYMAAEIYACNYDWPGNNVELWRLRTNSNATAAAGHDGRWRWFYYDLDASLGGGWNAAYTASYDSVAHATRFDSNDVYKGLAPISSPTLPGPFGRGTYLFRALLTNPQFKYAFVNRLADHMNTSFRRERMAALVDALKAQYQVEMTNHIVRWLAPSSISSWVTRVNRTRDFVTGRPPHIYQFVISNFALPGAADVVLDVSAATAGCIRINSLVIDTNTVGVTGMPYPWTGTYFRGIPMTISAVPRERHRFRQWAGLPGVTSAVATVILVSNLAITAEFDVYTNPPAISADALVFPAAPCEIMPATWTNIVWQPDRIHDAVSGTQCFLTVCLVNASDGAVQDVIATNAPNGLASAAWWPALRLVREDPYCIRLDARSQAGTMNSRTFTASPVYVIPEPAFALVALVFLCLRTQPPRTLTNDQCQMSNAQCPIAVRLSPPSLRRLPRRIS
ncbi:hypothetical protein GX586_02500, partial [bacterium]|nr:hypothetical protein [bacterium]